MHHVKNLLIPFVTTGVAVCAFAQAPDWENQAVFRINKEEPHAIMMPFPDAPSALAKKRLESPWAQSLNGTWRYHWVNHPDKRPTDFYKTDFNDSAWKNIPVPANVELHGNGIPIYTNITYPFHKDPPRVMGTPPSHYTTYADRNPVSSYRRKFTVPKNWSGREVFVTFNGVSSAFYLWINGEKVGYSEDSRTPAEFDISKHLRPGENLIAVEVYRFSDGSYLEDQDFWRMSGIFRDVYLWSSAPVDLRDFEVRASVADDLRTGELALTLKGRNHSSQEREYSVDVELLDPAGKCVSKSSIRNKAAASSGSEASLRLSKLEVSPWSAETPTLYSLLLTVKDAAGKPVGHYAQKVGFRTSLIRNGQLLINGKPVLIKGVNRHDHNPLTGQYVTEADMRADLEAMKRLNINAVRTCHYPNDPRFLELCDEYGFYVICEANIESHGMGYKEASLAKDPSWYAAHLDRIRNMLEAFKNHPSVVMWSMGNEAGDGVNFEQASAWLHQRDPSRPVHYEQGEMKAHVDLFSPMYFGIRSLEPWCRKEEQKPLGQQRPLIQCEYNHTMGNSSGGLAEYWRLIRSERLLQGGFIWDWKDQGIQRLTATPYGDRPGFSYGGDFGDFPNDDNFCFNGIMMADLRPNPHAVEVAHQYRNLLVSAKDLGSREPLLSVRNELFFTTLKGQPIQWSLLQDGVVVAKGMDTLPDCGPGQSVDWKAPVGGVKVSPNSEYQLTLEFPQPQATAWAPAGFVLAREQVRLAWGKTEGVPLPAARSSSVEAGLTTDDHNKLSHVSGPGVHAIFNDTNGQLNNLWLNGTQMLVRPLALEFWRAPTDNDRGNKMPATCGVWREAGPKAVVTKRETRSLPGCVELRYELSIPAGESKAVLLYQVYGDGVIDVSLDFSPAGEKLPVIPRVGMSCGIKPTLDVWSWFGRGPTENYIDRNEGTLLGVYSGRVGELWHAYSEPQETANRTDIRWANFTNDHGQGLRITPLDGQPLEIGAYPFEQADLEKYKHPEEILKRNQLTVHISHRQMGVGGQNSWGAWPLAEHQLKPDRSYHYAFRLSPLAATK